MRAYTRGAPILGLILAFAVVLLETGMRVRADYASQMPTYTPIPLPAMPAPNARDTFDKAEAMLKDADQIDLAILTTRPVQMTVPSWEKPIPLTYAEKHWHPYGLSRKEKLVKENEPAIRVFDTGLTQQYQPPVPMTFDAGFPYYRRDRQFARLLTLQAQVQEERGEWDAAMETCVDVLRLSCKISKSALYIGRLVSFSCDVIGRNEMSKIVGHLSGESAKKYALELALLDSERLQFSSTVRSEEEYTQRSFQNAFADTSWVKKVDVNHEGDTVNGVRGYMVMEEGSVGKTPAYVYNAYTKYMDQTAVYADLPWSTQIKRTEPRQPDDLMITMLTEPYDTLVLKGLADEAQDRMLEIALGLQAYRVEKGCYPAKLTDMSPNYLSALPVDPFSDNQAFRYKQKAGTYALYSVGTDMIDDGGRPIEQKTGISGEPKVRYEVKSADDKGDIVYGVNP